MSYRLRTLNLTLLLLTSSVLLFGALYLLFYLHDHNILDEKSLLGPLILIVGFIGAIVNFLFINHKTLVCILTDQSVDIDGKVIRWEDIRSYRVLNGSQMVKTLKIRLEKGRTLRLTHRKRFEKKDDFEKFIMAFQNRCIKANAKGLYIVEELPIWKTRQGKLLAYILIGLIVCFTAALLMKKTAPVHWFRYLVFVGLSIPYLLKVFRH